MSDFIGWALERWPFGVIVLLLLGGLYGGLLFGWGPDAVRPVSAQTMQLQISQAKIEVVSSVSTVQTQLKDISNTQTLIQNQAAEDRLDRLEQQLLWWRQQNCKSKDGARNYAWQKMEDLKQGYKHLTNTEWQMPTCSDIGD